MEYTMHQRAQMILSACMAQKSVDPAEIFRAVAAQDFVRMHGPEHHVLDGACILTAYHNAGGKVDLPAALEKLAQEGLRMPGATCGLWGVCGAVTSIGAALAIIDGTGPLSDDGSWGRHMRYTSTALKRIGEIDGPRCCKRDALAAFEAAVTFINENFDVRLSISPVVCGYCGRNAQCIGSRCPYHPGAQVRIP